MDAIQLTDEACERLICGHLSEGDADLLPVRWFVEDLGSMYRRPVPQAVRAMHPSATGRTPGMAVVWPSESRFCEAAASPPNPAHGLRDRRTRR